MSSEFSSNKLKYYNHIIQGHALFLSSAQVVNSYLMWKVWMDLGRAAPALGDMLALYRTS